MNPNSLKNLKRGGSPGRPKGSRTMATIARLEFASDLFDSQKYRDSLERRILAGRAMPMESLLWQYLHGKPLEQVNLSGSIAVNARLVNEHRTQPAD